MCDDPLAYDIEPEPWHTGEDEKLQRVQAALIADEKGMTAMQNNIDPSTEYHESFFTEEAIGLIRAAKPLVDYLNEHQLFGEYVVVSAINGVIRLSECHAIPVGHKWLT